MKYKSRRVWKRFKRFIYKKLLPDDDFRGMFLATKVGYEIPEPVVTKTIATQVVLNEASHKYLATSDGKAKYDVRYGLARQLAEQLTDVITYTETHDEENQEWTCRVALEVVLKK